MTLYVLGADVQYATGSGATILRAGKTVDSAQYNIAKLLAAGATLYPITASTLARAAALKALVSKGWSPGLIDEASAIDQVATAGDGEGASTVGFVSYSGVVAYQVLASDSVISFDASAWTTQAGLIAALPVAPVVGEKHVFFWDGWVLGAPPPSINAGVNPIVPYGSPVTSKARAANNETAITDFNGVMVRIWTGSAWVPG